MRLLVVEDDETTSNVMTNALRKEGFTCSQTDSGEYCIQLVKAETFDVVILDLMLLDTNGQEVIRRLRNANNTTPILVLSALNSLSEKINSLSAGADDFLAKPARVEELIARIKAIVRRRDGFAQSVLQVGDLKIDLQTKTSTMCGVPLKLTNKEYLMLELLMMKKGCVLNKEVFLNQLYDEMSSEPSEKIVDVFMCKLRKKLSKASNQNYIQTVWGRGYILSDNVQDFSGNVEKVKKTN